MIFWKITAVRKQVVNLKAHGLFLHSRTLFLTSQDIQPDQKICQQIAFWKSADLTL